MLKLRRRARQKQERRRLLETILNHCSASLLAAERAEILIGKGDMAGVSDAIASIRRYCESACAAAQAAADGG